MGRKIFMNASTMDERTSVTPQTKSRAKTRWLVLGALLLGLLAWAGFDLLAPRQTSLRAFDAQEVARLETAMWRSYYDKERLALFGQLAELLRQQYRLPLLRSNAVAFQAAKAAFVFKEGRGRSDYEKALPNLVKYYSAIRAVSDIAFDVDQVAKLELEWWIIHRERNKYSRADLDRSLAELPAALYQMPVEKFAEHARLRAEAMLIRDQKAEQGGVSDTDWQRIDELLQASWQSLHHAVNQ
jgi:hypothetical protein